MTKKKAADIPDAWGGVKLKEMDVSGMTETEKNHTVKITGNTLTTATDSDGNQLECKHKK